MSFVINDFMYMYMVITVQVLGDMLYYKINYNYNYNYKYYNISTEYTLGSLTTN